MNDLNTNLYCCNCSKFGHTIRNCPEPKISVGMICVKIHGIPYNINLHVIDKYFDVDSFNYSNISNISIMDEYTENIKFLLVRRKYSLNYLEFIRGNYDFDNLDNLKKILSLMSKDEIQIIKNNTFEYLWNSLWKTTSNHKIYKKEFIMSQNKFNCLKDKYFYIFDEINSWDETEWELPKGRRNNFETNINVAIREFQEETGLNENDYTILKNIQGINDTFIGTNNKKYKHIYFLSLANDQVKLEKDCEDDYEISEVKWLTLEESIKKIRPFYKSKISILNSVYFFILNMCEVNKKFYQNQMVLN